MTISQMSIHNATPSRHQRQHWLSEQALAWSGVPIVTTRPTMFLEAFFLLAGPSVRDRGRIEWLHRTGRDDRLADGVERVTGRPAMSVRDFVSLHADEFGGRRS